MTVFACAACGQMLTVPVSRVVLPAHAHQRLFHEMLGVLMEPGTYAVDLDLRGPRWEHAEAHPPAPGRPGTPSGAVVLAPGDVHGVTIIVDRIEGSCFGADWGNGPNLGCARCGRPVATRIDDCSLWQAVWLDPAAVVHADDARETEPVAWDRLRAERPGLPPVEQPGWWSPQWEAAVAVTLAHVLAVSGGRPVTVPDGLATDTFRRALDTLVPPGASARAMAPAGPGLPEFAADIALVPQHPQTGEHWVPGRAADLVPLSWDVWVGLAFPDDRGLLPMPAQEFRDDPPPLLPITRFEPDVDVFLMTLARLAAVGEPWLREIHDRVAARRRTISLWGDRLRPVAVGGSRPRSREESAKAAFARLPGEGTDTVGP